MKITTKAIKSKKSRERITMITAYDALFARLASEAGADIILVGDSLGNVVLGYESTIPVTMGMMLHHTSAVSRAKPESLVVADLPFARAQRSCESLIDDCARLVQDGGAEAVKIEGGASIAQKIEKLSESGIAVMAHIGLQPQQYLKLGGYRKFGKTPEERAILMRDAKTLESAGAFALLMEMTDPQAASEITSELSIPTIGIGSGSGCDGQVMVFADILGFTQNPPAFAKKFADLHTDVIKAYKTYFDEVRSGKYPQ